MNETVAAYGRVTQISHWLSALLILAMISIGLVMTRIEAGPGQDWLYRTPRGSWAGDLAAHWHPVGRARFQALAGASTGLSSIRTVAFVGAHVLL